MISLLHRIDTFLDADRIVLGRRSASLLEWERITGQVAAHCRNRLAAAAIGKRQPFATLANIELYRGLADELRVGGEENIWPPIVEVSDALALVNQPAPVRLEGSELVHIASVALELDHLREHFLVERARYPR